MKDFSSLKDYKGILSRISLATTDSINKPFYYIYSLEELKEMLKDKDISSLLGLGNYILHNENEYKIIDIKFEINDEVDVDFMKYGLNTRSSGQQYPFNFEVILIVE